MSDRWERLASTLGGATKVTARAFPGGISEQIWIDAPDGGKIIVRDAWWRKNPDIWIGWQVTRDDRDGYVVAESRPTKKRSEVAAAVAAFMTDASVTA